MTSWLGRFAKAAMRALPCGAMSIGSARSSGTRKRVRWCRSGLAAAIMAPRVFRDESIPVGPSWDDVKRLLAATQGDQPADIRARAALMLLAVYGLRAGEVVGLRLEDFDWEREVLTVRHGKRQRPRIYPLCRAVGDAVLRYLREVRPRSARREVFLNLRAPFGPLSCSPPGPPGQAAVTRLGRDLAALRPACSPPRLRHPLAGAGPVAEGDRRSPRAPISRDDPSLRQGRSGRTASRRGFRSGGLAMNIDELVTHYVAFRRTLGEKCKTNESILRSFCRAVGPQTSIAHIGAEVVAAFLDGSGSVTSGWFNKYQALKGFFRFAISRGHLTEAPAAEGPPEAPAAVRSVHLHPRRDPPVAGCDPVIPGLPHPD